MSPTGSRIPIRGPKSWGTRISASGKRLAGARNAVGTRKAPTGRRPNPVRIGEVAGKKAARSLWLWAAGGLVLALVIAGLVFLPVQKDGTPMTPVSIPGVAGSAEAPGPLPLPPAAPAPSPGVAAPEAPLALIEAVRLVPQQPTRKDNLRVEVVLAPGAPQKLAFTYRWRVNDRIVDAAKGDSLNLSGLKKQDRISVAVTPHDGETAGFTVESALVAVHSIAPSLEMEIISPSSKVGAPIELQLLSAAPDSAAVTFALDPPLLPGMVLDRPSGKISWNRPPDLKGPFRFGASVTDDSGTRVARVFEIDVKEPVSENTIP